MFAGFVAHHIAVLDQTTLLQCGEGTGDDFFPPVIVQHLLAQAAGVGVQQTGQDFFFQVFIDVHGYLFVAMGRSCGELLAHAP